LSKKLEIPVYHLDKYLWKPGWERVLEEDFTKAHNHILTKNSWIIDGVAYFSTVEKRFEYSDMIIYFDIDPEICKKRALIRMKEEKLRPNPYANDCSYDETEENIKAQNKVIDNFQEYKLKLDPLINKFKLTKDLIVVGSEIETKEILNQILNDSSYSNFSFS
jgi:adenylate kinase family enzyme